MAATSRVSRVLCSEHAGSPLVADVRPCLCTPQRIQAGPLNFPSSGRPELDFPERQPGKSLEIWQDARGKPGATPGGGLERRGAPEARQHDTPLCSALRRAHAETPDRNLAPLCKRGVSVPHGIVSSERLENPLAFFSSWVFALGTQSSAFGHQPVWPWSLGQCLTN